MRVTDLRAVPADEAWREGFHHEIGESVPRAVAARMSDDVREKVDARWSELGIELGQRGAGATPGSARGRRGIFGKRGS